VSAKEDPRFRALVDAAFQVGIERNAILEEMRRALLTDDTPVVIECARKLTGLDDTDEESNRSDSSLH